MEVFTHITDPSDLVTLLSVKIGAVSKLYAEE